VDGRADIYSVGVLLWESLARKRFSSGAIDAATIHKRVTGGEPRIREVVPDVPTELADICDKAIALRPDDRFATALEMKEALDTVLESRRERAKTHSLAVLVTEAFAEERSTIKTVIEEHAKVAYSERPGKTGSNPIPVFSPEPSDASNPTGSLPSAASIGGASVVMGGVRPPKASVKPWLAVVAVVGIAGETIAYVVSPGDSATSTAVPPKPLATSAAQQPDVTKVELIVIALPPDAVITLDGTQLSSNPRESPRRQGLRSRGHSSPHREQRVPDGLRPVHASHDTGGSDAVGPDAGGPDATEGGSEAARRVENDGGCDCSTFSGSAPKGSLWPWTLVALAAWRRRDPWTRTVLKNLAHSGQSSTMGG
jgi:MYXO-CTERM domain-containing protein